MFPHSILNGGCHHFDQRFRRLLPQRLICRGDRRAKITTGRLQPAERGAFSGAMDANQSFEEAVVCQFPRFQT